MCALLPVAAAAAPVAGVQRHRGDQEAAMEGRKQGQILPLREIERRVVGAMRGAQYLGFDFDADSAIYTLKFLRDGAVIWVDVDGRTGRIVGRTGP
ncbi:hypothetical protein ACBY01_12665 [Sphingomonas sp. ac-8]|uniref:hypothetical protein n=1 Tax=Sphingomonas sp. ac-8 TaxID=3242977 RepID=UPI003A8032EA